MPQNWRSYDVTHNIEINDGLASALGMQTAAIFQKIRRLNDIGEQATAVAIASRFPFLSINQVKHSLRTLEREGFVLAEQPESDKFNHVKIYKAVENCG